jgi:hypothetical protein
MPSALVETPGAPDANTFATLAEYKVYWGDHLYNTRALAATDAVITQALITVGRALNDLIRWTGAAASETQAMTWPRKGMATRNGVAIPETENPQDLKDAQCEWAGQYISTDLFATNSAQAKGIASLKAGPVAITYKDQSARTVDVMNADFRRVQPELAYASLAVPDFVRNILTPSWYTRELLSQPIMFDGHR